MENCLLTLENCLLQLENCLLSSENCLPKNYTTGKLSTQKLYHWKIVYYGSKIVYSKIIPLENCLLCW